MNSGRMKTLVVTGGIGSGKSTVCAVFASLGVPVYDSDSRTKSLYDSDAALVDAVGKALGCSVTDDRGHLDRRLLASLVFNDRQRLKMLESVVHPRVLDDFRAWKNACEAGLSGWNPAAGNVPFVIFESAIILEKPLFRSVADKILLVDAPLGSRVSRAALRDGVPEDRILDRISSQRSPAPGEADYILMNDADEAALRRKVLELCPRIWA